MKARFLAVRERSYKGKGETKASPAVLGWNHRYEYKQNGKELYVWMCRLVCITS